MKAIELYETLSIIERRDFFSWLEKRHKTFSNEKNALNILLKSVNSYLQAHSAPGNEGLTWEEWLQKNPKIVIKNLKNEATDLYQEIEKFLLNERKKDDSKILRLIDLYYIYRERGIKDRQSEIIKSLSVSIKHSKELYLHYLHKQLQIEAFNASHANKNEDMKKELLEIFYINWMTDYIFLACHNKEPELLLNPFFEKIPEIKKNEIIVFYTTLHTFVMGDLQSINQGSIAKMYSELIKNFPLLPSYRQKDCFLLFLNKIMNWLSAERTYPRLTIVLPYIEKGLDDEKGWLYVGKYIHFMTYSNYVGQIFILYDEKRVKMGKELHRIEKTIKKNVNFLGEKQEELLDLRIKYYIGGTENYKTVYDTDTRKFPDILHKLQLIILQLKAGFLLTQSREKKMPKTYQFWQNVDYILGHYHLPPPEETKGIRWQWIIKEWGLWKDLYVFVCLKEKNSDKYAQAIKNIEDWRKEYEKPDNIFLDKSWYITFINQHK